MPLRRTVLVTGASSGLGRGMARELAARGRDLALCARRTERLDELRAELLDAHPGVRVAVRRLDVDDPEQVMDVFASFREELGTIDRVVVNAGLGKGQPVGTGGWRANAQTLRTNVLGAHAQVEAAMEAFRAQGHGHLVVVSSVGAVRGMPRNVTAYSASKAALATLAEGVRAETLGTPIAVTTLYPGYIRSEMNEGLRRIPFVVDTETGCRALVAAMEREPARAYVPRWPWAPVSLALRVLPLRVVARMV
ncbi:SDR family oxidoreductase [Thalassiella azotivora]